MRRRSSLVSVLLLSLVFGLGSASATLTNGQCTAFGVDVNTTNQSEFAALVANADDQLIANAYNLDASPVYWVWRTRVTRKEIYEAPSVDATTWSWPDYIARSVAEKSAWGEMFNNPASEINPALANTRQGVADIFSQASGANQRTHLLATGRRHATRAEKLFATGTGSTGSPGTMTFEGSISRLDVAHCVRNVPLP